eukprot:2471161-Amphidinium_carterae.1
MLPTFSLVRCGICARSLCKSMAARRPPLNGSISIVHSIARTLRELQLSESPTYIASNPQWLSVFLVIMEDFRNVCSMQWGVPPVDGQ